MELQFLYTDDSYQETLSNINLPDNVVFSQSTKSGLHLFSYEIKGENSDGARTLSNIKIQLAELLDKEKYFLLIDGASEYYNNQLFPLYNCFERNLRQVISMAAVQDGNLKTQQRARELEYMDFGKIYESLFTSQDFWGKFKSIKGDMPLSKKDLIAKINALEEKTLWDEMFTRDFPFLPDNFDTIRIFRNDVMHAHNISYEKYKESKKLIELAIIELNRIKGLITNFDILSSSFEDILNTLVKISKNAALMKKKIIPVMDTIYNINNVYRKIGLIKRESTNNSDHPEKEK